MPASAAAATIERRDLVDGLGKGLRVIEAFDDDHPQLTASDAAARAGIRRTAARRYLLSLVHFDYDATDASSSGSRRACRAWARATSVRPSCRAWSSPSSSVPRCASFTAHTVTDPGRFRAYVLLARTRGYSHTEQQLDAVLQGVSVALMDRKGACRGAAGSTVPMTPYRSSAEMLEAVLPLLRDGVQSLRPLLQRLAARGPARAAPGQALPELTAETAARSASR